ncbi:uncharacterized protein LOC103714614 [Phoenix dactylifera]|uniref:Uncharacterized protein LOC103714614 n=1 Tax=Phoenix dactylifera TaxID=42345 RepID=A0A8B7CIY4_PHODC|nr:uncharacterized protein LOC103714614 [Phoenix dactylifera]
MGESGVGGPAMAPLNVERGEERWRHFDSSVNAVSFGFVATAILISMFVVMAILERFLRPRPPFLSSNDGRRRRGSPSVDLEAQRRRGLAGKLGYPSPKMSVYAKGVSVLMPGHDIPTFIAHPAPAPLPPERSSWPSHQHNLIAGSKSNLS